MLRFLCPWCGKLLKSPENWAGRVARCARCQGKCRVPAPLLQSNAQRVHRDRKLRHRLMGLLLLAILAGIWLLCWQDLILDHLRTRLGKWREAWL